MTTCLQRRDDEVHREIWERIFLGIPFLAVGMIRGKSDGKQTSGL